MNLGAAVFDNVTQKVFLHFTVGFKNPSGESVMLVTEDYGVSWHKVTNSEPYTILLESVDGLMHHENRVRRPVDSSYRR